MIQGNTIKTVIKKLMLIFMTITFCFNCVLFYGRTQSFLKQHSELSLKENVERQLSVISRSIMDEITLISWIAENIKMVSTYSSKNLAGYLNQLTDDGLHFCEIKLYDSSGINVNDRTDTFPLEGRSLSYQVLKEDGNTQLQMIYPVLIENEAAYYLVVKYSNENLKALFGGDIYERLTLSETIYTYVLDRDGNVVVSYGTQTKDVPQIISQDMVEEILQNRNGYIEVELHGEKLRGYYQETDYNDWLLVNLSFREDLERSVYGYIRIVVFFVIMSSICLAVLYSLVVKPRLRQAKYDGLTGLMNKSSIVTHIKRHLATQNGVLCVMDLDNFKQVNDIYGHSAGDMVLRQVADLLKLSFRKADLIGRFGGDEYIVFLTTEMDAERLTERMNVLLETIQEIGRKEYSESGLSASMGAVYCYAGAGYEEAFKLADEALYCAKSKGKAQICISTRKAGVKA